MLQKLFLRLKTTRAQKLFHAPLLPEPAGRALPRIVWMFWAQGLADGYMRALTDLGVFKEWELLELVDDGNTGVLFEPGAAADLARGIWEIFEQPTSSWARSLPMGGSGVIRSG